MYTAIGNSIKMRVIGLVVLCYREALKHHYNLKQYWLEVDLEDLRNFDEGLADKLVKLPSHYLSLVSGLHV